MRKNKHLENFEQQLAPGSTGAIMRLPAGVHVTAIGASFPVDMPIEDWISFGRLHYTTAQSMVWILVDWIKFGQKAYGEKYREALEQTGYAYQTLINMVSVDNRIYRRRYNLSFSLHAAVARLEPEKQDEVLDMAERDDMSVRQVRDVVRSMGSKSSSNLDNPLGVTRAMQIKVRALSLTEKDWLELNKGERLKAIEHFNEARSHMDYLENL